MHMKYLALYLRMRKPPAGKKSSISILKNNTYHHIMEITILEIFSMA